MDNSVKFNRSSEFRIIREKLASLFPDSQGWKIFNRYSRVSYINDYIIHRDTLNGGSEKILIEVNLEKVPGEENISSFRSFSRKLAANSANILLHVIAGPDLVCNADLPKEINYLPVESLIQGDFNFSKNDLNKLVA